MSVHQMKDQKYSLKGSAQCSDQFGNIKRNLQVLAGSAEEDHFSQTGIPHHAQVALKEGTGSSATTIAFFSAEQARQLANSLNAAADATDATGADIAADC